MANVCKMAPGSAEQCKLLLGVGALGLHWLGQVWGERSPGTCLTGDEGTCLSCWAGRRSLWFTVAQMSGRAWTLGRAGK